MSGSDLSANEFSALIEAIYDCALDPQHWSETCREIGTRCDSTAGGICIRDLRHEGNHQLFVFGYSPECLHALREHYADSPMAASDAVAPLGNVSTLSMPQHHPQHHQQSDSRFVHAVLEPFHLLDIIWFPALRTASHRASLHASRTDTSSPYQLRDIRLFEQLAPHVCRALAISDALHVRARWSDTLEEALDGLAVGVFLTAHDGCVVYMNSAAERQVKAGASIHLVEHQICPTHSGARSALAKAIRQAGDRSDATLHEQTLAIPDGKGGGYVATLLPLQGGLRRDMPAAFDASVAVFMQDPALAPLMPGEAFASLHGLTGGELRVLLALAQGLGGTEVAGMLGITEPTIRTHLQHIYAKTGTSRQAELMRLLHSSTPPVRTQDAALPGHGPAGGPPPTTPTWTVLR